MNKTSGRHRILWKISIENTKIMNFPRFILDTDNASRNLYERSDLNANSSTPTVHEKNSSRFQLPTFV